MLINETGCSAAKPLAPKNFITYFRERIGRRMCGVAVLVHKTLVHSAVKVEVGNGDYEYVTVKLECFKPGAVYGQQKNQNLAILTWLL